MATQSFGQKIKMFKRTAKAEVEAGQARLPEHRYVGIPFQYDVSKLEYVDKFEIGLVVAEHKTTKNLIAPYTAGDANYGKPIGIILEPQDLETDLNTSVYVQGAWDTDVIAIKGIDVNDPAQLLKLNATNFNGLLFWNMTIPVQAGA